MIAAAQAWRILGITPTDDRREVKRAYAARLKAMDPDADVGAFQRLREALATATMLAEQAAAKAARVQGIDAPVPTINSFGSAVELHFNRLPRGRPAADPLPLDLPTPPPPKVKAKPDPGATNRAQLRRLLRQSGDDPLARKELLATYRELLADERMEQVGYSEEFEDWLASQLSRSGTGADALIPLAMERFGWTEELGKARPRQVQLYLARRGQDLRAVAALDDPSHDWHEAFVRLQEPAPDRLELKDRLRLGPKIGELLASLRLHNPGVEWVLTRDHVAIWEEALAKVGSGGADLFKSDRVSWFGWLAIVVIAFSVIRLAFPAATFEPLERPDRPEQSFPEMAPTSWPANPDRIAPVPPSTNSSLPRSQFHPEALPRKIQECIDAGGKLRTTATQYICSYSKRPLPAAPPQEARPVVTATDSVIPSTIAPPVRLPATDPVFAPLDPNAVAKVLSKEVADCLKRGGDPKNVTNGVVCHGSRNAGGSQP